MELPALEIAHVAERRIGDDFPTRRLSAALAVGTACASPAFGSDVAENVEQVAEDNAVCGERIETTRERRIEAYRERRRSTH